ncbi:zinc-binding dehydrogenase [Streptomyces sp. NPDC058623]|uniref:zinc-binding dehydrogenase n=1 Tax=Streptomyces sp. NPDC058623 TaxID=3346563 RepID=UPI00365DBAA9
MYREPLSELLEMVEDGRLTPQVGGVHPLAEAARAHEDLRARRTVGKLVLDTSRWAFVAVPGTLRRLATPVFGPPPASAPHTWQTAGYLGMRRPVAPRCRLSGPSRPRGGPNGGEEPGGLPRGGTDRARRHQRRIASA